MSFNESLSMSIEVDYWRTKDENLLRKITIILNFMSSCDNNVCKKHYVQSKQYQELWVVFRFVRVTNKLSTRPSFSRLSLGKKKILCRPQWSWCLGCKFAASRNMAVAICPRVGFLSPLLSHIGVDGDLIRETSPCAHLICDACRELCVICQAAIPTAIRERDRYTGTAYYHYRV